MSPPKKKQASLNKYFNSHHMIAQDQPAAILNDPSTTVPAITTAVEPGSDLEQFQPPKSFTFPRTLFGKKMRSVQHTWLSTYPWIHYQNHNNSILCQVCRATYNNNLFNKGRRLDLHFINVGFTNWKKGLETLKQHAESDQHLEALEKDKLNRSNTPTVSALLNSQHLLDQQNHRIALNKIVESCKFLLHKGLPFQGNEDNSGNLYELLELRANDVPQLHYWLQRKRKWLSHEVQNEIIELIAKNIQQHISQQISKCDKFSIISDGTQDIEGKLYCFIKKVSCNTNFAHVCLFIVISLGHEQLSVVFRYVTPSLEIKEDFVGFYQLSSSTGLVVSKAIEDVALRLQIDLSNMRGLGFDGASNMSGMFKGARSILKNKHHLAEYVHCTNHSLDLALQEVAKENSLVRDALEHVRTTANFVRGSGKRRQQFDDICQEIGNACDSGDSVFSKINSICPTRWTVRVRGLRAMIQNWQPLTLLFEQLSEDKSLKAEVRATAQGILARLKNYRIFVGLVISLEVFEKCELLAKQLQSKQSTACSSLSGSRVLVAHLSSMRSNDKFLALYNQAIERAEKLNIQEPDPPKARKMPARFDSGTAPRQCATYEEFIRKEYFEVLDLLIEAITDRYLLKDIHCLHNIA